MKGNGESVLGWEEVVDKDEYVRTKRTNTRRWDIRVAMEGTKGACKVL